MTPEIESVPDLYQLAFMPGQFRCPQCDFRLSKQTMSVAQGCIGTTPDNRESEPCPNDGTMMVHVTYREQLESYAERLKEEFDRRDADDRDWKQISLALGFENDQTREALCQRARSLIQRIKGFNIRVQDIA